MFRMVKCVKRFSQKVLKPDAHLPHWRVAVWTRSICLFRCDESTSGYSVCEGGTAYVLPRSTTSTEHELVELMMCA